MILSAIPPALVKEERVMAGWVISDFGYAIFDLRFKYLSIINNP